MANPASIVTEPRAGLGLLTLSALVVANMVGAGVFTSSGFALASVGSPGRVMLAWWLCGVWAIAGAVAYGGLVRRLPLSGGEYLFLSRLVHPSVGFLAGWISVVAGFTAPIAVAAQGAALYALGDVPPTDWRLTAVAIGLIVVASLFHLIGMSLGTGLQNAIVAAKLALLAVIIGWAFLFTSTDVWQGAALPGHSLSWWPEDSSAWTVLVGSMSWIALSYTGFNAAIYVAGQAKDARRTVPLAMLWGTLVVTVVYLLLNYVFVYAPAPDAISNQTNVASIAAEAVGGTTLALLVRVTIVLAMVSSVFAMLLAGPRVYQKMAEDGVMPKLFHSAGGAPRWATTVQAGLSCVAVFMADLLQLMKYLGLTLSACGALAVLSLWWARRRIPDAQPLRWWETAAMFVYLLITLAILWASRLTHAPEFNAMLVTFALGVIVYLAWNVRDMTAIGSTRRAANKWHELPACGSEIASWKFTPQSWPKCGTYELIKQLGEGRSADIYLARGDQTESAEVIVKVLRPVSSSLDELPGWERQADLLQRLDHPNIVCCLGAGRVDGDGIAYLAMPRVIGETLWELVQRDGGLAQTRALPLLQQIASAVSAVHELGYIHGDLAPKNLMVSDGKRITLIDFGLARAIDSAKFEQVRGTPAFMSPESCQAADSAIRIGQASDIYSFGCLAFFILTGKLPVDGATSIEILWKQIHETPPKASSLAALPISAALDELISQCLEKSPEARPSSMANVLGRLQYYSKD
jgi:amino acid transporter